jgi:arylsulfate sulfotransferase
MMKETKSYTHLQILALVFIILTAGCDSSKENLYPEISFEEAFLEGDELTKILIKSTATDVDGTIVAYEWDQISGTSALLEGVNSATLIVTLPDVSSDETLVFSLSVTDNDSAITVKEVTVLVRSSLADNNLITSLQITERDTNISVFISSLDVDIDRTLLSRISFLIEPKYESIAEPFKVTYAIDKLTQTNNGINLPVYGLYSNYQNSLELTFLFTDNSSQDLSIEITTNTYEDARDVYDNVQIIKEPDTLIKPTYSYFLLKSAASGPVIMDIDGNIRWVSSSIYDSSNSTYIGGVVYVTLGNLFIKHDLADTKFQTPIGQPPEFSGLTNIATHHNVDKGKFGVLVEIDADKEGLRRLESILWETDLLGNVIKEWDFGEIIENYMIENGDNADNFVRHGIDWCHMNSAIYDKSDDSIIVSCRENFVIKVDYESSNIKWLLGDETKYWYTFPSLRALSLFSLDTKPIGQHALSIVNNELMLFNNGLFSFNSPVDESRGLSLSSSRASRYSIDVENRVAEMTWDYDPGLYSDVCSSIYKDSEIGGDYLINFAAINRTNGQVKKIILQGLNEEKDLLFEYHLLSPEPPCITAWNAEPISDLTNLMIH